MMIRNLMPLILCSFFVAGAAVVSQAQVHTQISDKEMFVATWLGDVVYVRVQTPAPANNQGRGSYLLIHGVSDTSETFDSVAARLLASGHQVARMDLLGHGRTLTESLRQGHPTPHEISMASQAQAVAAVVKALNLKNFVLVGHSYGGAVVTAAAGLAEVSKKLKALHLLAPFVYRADHMSLHANLPYTNWDWAVQGLSFPAPCDLIYETCVVPGLRDFYHRVLVKRWKWNPDKLSDEQKQKLEVVIDGAVAATRGMRPFYTAVEIKQIAPEIPTHLTVAKEDQLIPLVVEEALHKVIQTVSPSGHYQVLEGTHMFHQEHPEQIVQMLEVKD